MILTNAEFNKALELMQGKRQTSPLLSKLRAKD